MASVTKERSYLDPDRLYSLRGFQEASGISATRLREARRAGVDVLRLKVGRRVFIRGADAIAFIEALAQLGTRNNHEKARRS
jgi:hypothetical protein